MSPVSKLRKHIPKRTCVICRRVLSKRELTRVVRTPDAGVQIDPTGKLAGRGAYLCSTPSCWERAARGDAMLKALKTTLSTAERDSIAAHGANLSPVTES
jgi:predicted RNA-binding protein YlxR (DUF448 family)